MEITVQLVVNRYYVQQDADVLYRKLKLQKCVNHVLLVSTVHTAHRITVVFHVVQGLIVETILQMVLLKNERVQAGTTVQRRPEFQIYVQVIV